MKRVGVVHKIQMNITFTVNMLFNAISMCASAYFFLCGFSIYTQYTHRRYETEFFNLIRFYLHIACVHLFSLFLFLSDIRRSSCNNAHFRSLNIFRNHFSLCYFILRFTHFFPSFFVCSFVHSFGFFVKITEKRLFF